MVTIGRFGSGLIFLGLLAGLTPVAAIGATTADRAVRPVGPPSDPLTVEECSQLYDDYRAALITAKFCNTRRHADSCSVRVRSNLICECTTFVDPFNHKAIAAMTAAESAWNAGGCAGLFECGGGLCPSVSGATCEPIWDPDDAGRAEGLCTDRWF